MEHAADHYILESIFVFFKYLVTAAVYIVFFTVIIAIELYKLYSVHISDLTPVWVDVIVYTVLFFFAASQYLYFASSYIGNVATSFGGSTESSDDDRISVHCGICGRFAGGSGTCMHCAAPARG